MRSRPTNRPVRWFLTAIILLFVASALVSVTTVALQGSRNADAAADEILERIGLRTADLIDGQLQPATVSLEQMSLSMEDLVGTTVASREHMLAAQLQTMPSLTGAFVALPDGSFHFVRRIGDDLVLKRIRFDDGERTVVEGPLDETLRPTALDPITDDFDPRVRPWYLAASESPGVTAWTSPYVFFSSEEPGVTAATAVTDDDGVLQAVVGLDITLTSLSDAVENLPIDATAEAFIVADDTVIAAPSDQGLVATDARGEIKLVTTDELGLAADDGRIATTDLRREGLPDWSIVVRADHIAFVDAVERQTRIAIIAVVLAVVIGLAMLTTLGMRLRRPIDELTTLAERDPLTDLPNRRALLTFGGAALVGAAEDDTDVAVAMIDVDHFKSVNDEHGHSVGDETLRRLGDALRQVVRPDDLVGRYGGDEFVIVLIGTDREGALVALERIKTVAEDDLQSHPETVDCSLTIGLATRNGRNVDIAALIAEADHELLAAKRARGGHGRPMTRA